MSVKSLAALAACAGALFSADAILGQEADLAAAGQSIARTHCSGCHAMGRQDLSPVPQAPPLRSLAKRYPLHNLAESLAEGAIAGHPEMPELEGNAIKALVGYIGSISEE